MRTFLGQRPLTRRRFDKTGPDTDADGFPITDNLTAVDTTFQGSVQVLKGNQRQVMVEGVRVMAQKKLYCNTGTLRTEDDRLGIRADEVIDGAKRYTVVYTDDDHPLIPHQKAFLIEVQQGVDEVTP